MLLKIGNPKLFTDLISIISDLVLEVKAKISKNGLEIVAIDPANVALVSLNMPTKFFSEFNIDKEEELGLNLEDFKQILRRVGSSENIEIEKKDNTLILRTQDRAKRIFQFSLIHLDIEDKKIPELTFTSQIELDCLTFSEAINDAIIVADSVLFQATDNSFVIEARGTLNSSKTEFSSDEIKISSQGIVKAKYSLDYLAKFIKSLKVAEKAKISFGNDYPARFDFVTPDDIQLSFILAPRIEEE